MDYRCERYNRVSHNLFVSEDRLTETARSLVDNQIEEQKEPLEILKMRYAEGEISKEEYEEMKETLEE
jgi:uncharacterized membrane protein